jgi:O-acetyl-ADP-ribose deacetylase (regulator of RNase III)
MGKGLAAEFKRRYPEMFTAYQRLCQDGKLEIGKLWLWKANDQWVLNFPTKKHWRNPSKLSYVEAGLKKFLAEYERRGIREISFPRLGCGNGGLDWQDVKPLMEQYLRRLPIPAYIHDFEKDIVRDFSRSHQSGYLSEGGAVHNCFEPYSL